MTKPQRKAQIESLRQQGRDDRDEGVSRQRYKPFASADDGHLRDGWDERDAELKRSAVNDRQIIVTDAISEVDDEATQVALYAIFEYVREKVG